MNIVSTKKCPNCGMLGKVVNSNNPISPGICLKCLNYSLKWNDLKDADKFCRTYNIPFNPDKWVKMAEEYKDEVWAEYTKVISDEYKEKTGYIFLQNNDDLWEEANSLWHKNLEFNNILENIESIKEGWLKIMRAKWGPQYEFQQYLRLEELVNNTIKSTGTTNTLTIDNIRKIAIISVKMDEALENGEIKEAGEYSKMHQALIKSAGLDEMMDVTSEEGTINTVSDLCSYLEDHNFKFKFYDNVSRDIVDKTIKDQQEWTKNFVLNATGIQQTYNIIEDAYKSNLEENKAKQATEKINLSDLVDSTKREQSAKFDEELNEESFSLEDDDNEDYKY